MPKILAVALDEGQDQFVRDQVVSQHYASADEVVQAGLRLLQQREAELAHIRDALSVGEQSGVSNRTVDDIFDTAWERFQSRNG